MRCFNCVRTNSTRWTTSNKYRWNKNSARVCFEMEMLMASDKENKQTQYLPMRAKNRNYKRRSVWIWQCLRISSNDAKTLRHGVYCTTRQRPMDCTIYSPNRLDCLPHRDWIIRQMIIASFFSFALNGISYFDEFRSVTKIDVHRWPDWFYSQNEFHPINRNKVKWKENWRKIKELH